MTDQKDNPEQPELDPSVTNDESTTADIATDSSESHESLEPSKPPESSEPNESLKKCRGKVGWIVAFALLLALIAVCFGGYRLRQEQAGIRAQMAGFATSAEIDRQAALLADQNLSAEQNKDLVKAQLLKIQALESALSTVQKEQQLTAQTSNQQKQSITLLGQEQQRLAAKIEEVRQARQIPQGDDESILKNEITALVRMAQDQLELNRNAERARHMLASAADRIKSMFNSNLDSLSGAIQADIARLEQFVEVDRAAILDRLIALEATLSRAQLKSAPPVVRLGSSVEPPHSVVDQSQDSAASSAPIGFQDRLKSGWDLFTSHLGGYIRIHRHAPKPAPLPEPLDVGRLQLEIRQWFGIARVSLFTDESDVFRRSIQSISSVLADNFDLDSTGLRADYDSLRALGNQQLHAVPNEELRAAKALQELTDRHPSTTEAKVTGAEE